MAANKFLLIPEDIYKGLMECPKKQSPRPQKEKPIKMHGALGNYRGEEAAVDPGMAFSRMMMERVKKTKGADKAKRNSLYNQALLNYRLMRMKKEEEHEPGQGPSYRDDGSGENFTDTMRMLRPTIVGGLGQANRRMYWKQKRALESVRNRVPNKKPHKGSIILLPKAKSTQHFSTNKSLRIKPALWK